MKERKFSDFLNEQLQDPEFKKEYEKPDKELDPIFELIHARHQQNMTQKELADKCGMTQADISKIESGQRPLSLKILERIADVLNMDLKIQFVTRK